MREGDKVRVFLLVLLLACRTAPQGPYAVVRLYDPSAWTQQDLKDVEAGVVTWQGMGFIPRLENEPKAPLCPNDWYKRRPQVTNCMIRVGIVRQQGLMASDGAMGNADRVTDTIRVDASLKRFDLIHVVAHELGHVLMNTIEHTSKGVMLSGGWEWVLSAQDKALACKTIARGCP